MNKPIVIKISGHRLTDPDYLTEFATVIADIAQPVVIVHGGGVEISALQSQLGIETQYIDGQRVTDEASMPVVTMVMRGTVNARLVRYLVLAGVDAQGISGVDRGMIRARKLSHPTVDLGYTGEVVSVRGDIITNILEQGITPVISPVSMGEDSVLNVNADLVTGAVAPAIEADAVYFISNVAGVMVADKTVATLTAQETKALIADGTIYGGMIPKVQTALDAVASGVPRAIITDLNGLKRRIGTTFTAS